mmetsp:Transcript_13926/g.33092  ORF Transcript_13926/g.33092 Transcript_13926/m.33092 type:complete len:205 (+) Transcript_13926:197-811(+)
MDQAIGFLQSLQRRRLAFAAGLDVIACHQFHQLVLKADLLCLGSNGGLKFDFRCGCRLPLCLRLHCLCLRLFLCLLGLCFLLLLLGTLFGFLGGLLCGLLLLLGHPSLLRRRLLSFCAGQGNIGLHGLLVGCLLGLVLLLEHLLLFLAQYLPLLRSQLRDGRHGLALALLGKGRAMLGEEAAVGSACRPFGCLRILLWLHLLFL